HQRLLPRVRALGPGRARVGGRRRGGRPVVRGRRARRDGRGGTARLRAADGRAPRGDGGGGDERPRRRRRAAGGRGVRPARPRRPHAHAGQRLRPGGGDVPAPADDAGAARGRAGQAGRPHADRPAGVPGRAADEPPGAVPAGGGRQLGGAARERGRAVSPGLRGLTRDRGLLFGGDYNPEQWPEEVWAEDVRLMKEAGVNLVTVGVFSWARIEPEPGVRDFGWLDRVLDLLAGAGVAVDLATPTASPPPWLGHRWPETLPVDESGHRLWCGSRNQFCPSSPVDRERARALVTDLAARYAGHPALALWHVGNEYGQVCHCDTTAEAFRAWLRGRHGGLDGLNEAWGTAFWSQRYSAWEEVLPPRRAPYLINPAQRLDFRRFCSDALLAHFKAERDVLRAHTPDIPVTTNFMGFFPHADYWSWAPEEDVVSNDWYTDPADPLTHVRAALTHDLMRSLVGGPWMLMGQSVPAVNWRTHDRPNPRGRHRLASLQAVARGADGLCYFQWRASRSGAERFHSAILPHAGPDTRLH